MGSYAELYLGDISAGSFKSDIPLESLLMFTQEDLQVSERVDDEGDSYAIYQFKTTVKQAKHRLNARGITLGLCRQLYAEFKASELSYVDSGPANQKFEIKYIPNHIDFENYLEAFRRIYRNAEERHFFNIDTQWGDREARWVAQGSVFNYDVSTYFGDIAFCIFARSFLEAIPNEHSVVLDVTDLVHSGYIDEEELPSIFDFYMSIVLRRIELDYKIYGFVIEDDPTIDSRLRKRIDSLNESRFITHVLHPLLKRMGFEHVRKVDFHGPGEFGADILPFRYVTPLRTLEYYAVQAKAVPIHGSSAKGGNAAELVSQAMQAFFVTFMDRSDNERKRIDKFIIATNSHITSDARRFIEDALEGKRRMVFLDLDRVVDLVKEYRLVQYILFTDFETEA